MNNLDILKHKASQLLEKRLAKQKQLSGAHSKSHLIITANLTQLVGKIYKFSDQELFLSYFAALFHDIVRSPAQDKDLKDEELSSKQASKLLENFKVSDEEKEAVSYAIINHGSNPKWMENPITREDLPQSLKEKVRFALFVADKIEQNGVRVIARRSAFIAERFAPAGDLKSFGFVSGKDELLAVAIESIIRLTFITPQYIYSNKLEPLLKPLYKIHLDFVSGILKALNLSVERLAEILLNTKRSDGKNFLDIRKIQVKDQHELINLIEKNGQITDQKIQQVADQLKEASREAINYFSSNYKTDLDQVIRKWNPESKIGKDWYGQMIEYLNGNWYKSIENQI